MKVAILGHNGMLGHVLKKYLIQNNIEVLTTEYRWPTKNFRNFIESLNVNEVVNCIGQIPQKSNCPEKLFLNNFSLPIYLSQFFKFHLTHVTTDCEFCGSKDINLYYDFNDVQNEEDDYGKSKSLATNLLLKQKNSSVIRSSIIGPELFSKKSLWEWFVNCNDDSINGYCNHLWNGVTTLEWSINYLSLLQNKKLENKIIQFGSPKVSKYEILTYINKHLSLNKKILKYKTNTVSKLLKTAYLSKSLEKQIKNLIDWYY